MKLSRTLTLAAFSTGTLIGLALGMGTANADSSSGEHVTGNVDSNVASMMYAIGALAVPVYTPPASEPDAWSPDGTAQDGNNEAPNRSCDTDPYGMQCDPDGSKLQREIDANAAPRAGDPQTPAEVAANPPVEGWSFDEWAADGYPRKANGDPANQGRGPN